MKQPQRKRPPKVKPDSAQNVTMRIHTEKLQGLDAIARRLGITRNAVIQIAIAEKLERENKQL